MFFLASGKGVSSYQKNTLLYAVYRLGYKGRCTVHGFRTNFSTIANESGKWSADAIERAIAHREKNQMRVAYHRTDYLEQRRELMQWWANLLQQMEYGAEIIPLKVVK